MSQMLKLIPKSWFSWDFLVTENNSPLAEIDLAGLREKGTLNVQGTTYAVYREGIISGAFILESDGSPLASAKKLSAFFHSFDLKYGDRCYTLQARSRFRLAGFSLMDGDMEVGWIERDGIFGHRATAFLPKNIQLPVKVFILWLVVIMWRRDSHW